MPDHVRRRPEEPGEASSERAPAAPSTPAVEAILRMQQTYGNQAVARSLASARNVLARDPTAEAEAERVKKLGVDYDAAVKAGDWEQAAELLNAYNEDDIKTRVKARTAAELRLLDDGAERKGHAGRLRPFIAAGLTALGATETQAKPGRQYGEITVKYGTKKDGDKATKKRGNYPTEIEFKPDAAAVNADEIAFIQKVRLVKTGTNENKDWDATNLGRATAKSASIDRLSGRKHGWYGYNDDETYGNVKPWKKAAPATAAWMYDDPGAGIADSTWEFETAAVCRAGTDAGTVYATITWGFTMDADFKVTGISEKIFNKPTKDFGEAIDKWNAQAAGPAAARNKADQAALPVTK